MTAHTREYKVITSHIITWLLIGYQGCVSGLSLNIIPSGPYSMVEGKNIVFTCVVRDGDRKDGDSRDFLPIKWFGLDDRIVEQDNRIYSEEEDLSSSLFIKDIQEEDSGYYSCKSGEVQAIVCLTVVVGISFPSLSTVQSCTVGKDCSILCRVRANPAASVDWKKEDSIRPLPEPKYEMTPQGLFIRNVSRHDGGGYICRARVAETGQLEERSIQLQLQEPPSWIKKPEDQRFLEGETAKIECLVSAVPRAEYSWRKHWPSDYQVTREGSPVDSSSGILTIPNIRKADMGNYSCMANNRAGMLEASTFITVNVKPMIDTLDNVTVAEGVSSVTLSCIARGDPKPEVHWRKLRTKNYLAVNLTTGLDRIAVDEDSLKPSSVTLGHDDQGVEVTHTTLTIFRPQPSDAGLYKCVALNTAGGHSKTAKLTVEFGPTFELQEMDVQWSWDQKPASLSCVAHSVPVAAVTWWVGGQQIGRQILDKNFKIRGLGPESELFILPVSDRYYGTYECRAENKHGTAVHPLQLAVARPPGQIRQVVVEKVTATNLHFRFVPPEDTGGVSIDSYIAEYKEARQSWEEARRRYWFHGPDGSFELGDLEAWTSYDIRFGCSNQVGYSPWGEDLQITLPKPGPPDSPMLYVDNVDVITMEEVIVLDNCTVELSWETAGDNGAAVDYYQLEYARVEDTDPSQTIMDTGQEDNHTVLIISAEQPHTWTIQSLPPHSTVQVWLTAHNKIGFSEESSVLVATPAVSSSPASVLTLTQTSSSTSSFSHHSVLTISAFIILTLIFVDFASYKTFHAGFLFKSLNLAVISAYKRIRKRRSGQTVRGQNRRQESLK